MKGYKVIVIRKSLDVESGRMIETWKDYTSNVYGSLSDVTEEYIRALSDPFAYDQHIEQVEV